MPPDHRIRPFGTLTWILGKLPSIDRWTVVGALSAEDRCLAATSEVLRIQSRAHGMMLHIVPESGPTDIFAASTESRIDANVVLARRFGSRVKIVDSGNLLCAEHEVIQLAMTVASECSPNVVLDISTIPKRFFFPLLTSICDRNDIVNLIVTNTSPVRYGDVLAENVDNWKPLPMYDGDPMDSSSDATLIIGVGYQQLRVHEYFEENKSRRIGVKLLLPFPSIHPGFIHNWKFIHRISEELSGSEKVGGNSPAEVIRVPTGDVSLTFDRLLQQTGAGVARTVVLAPFGPKPISLAMCLLGIARRARGDDPNTLAPILPTEIGYTQPKSYRPDYSTGVAERDGYPDVSAYCVRLNGRDLYTLP